MSSTTGTLVVIASAPSISAWRLQLDSQPQARIFSDADFLAALEVIIAERPEVIALDPVFAATARGAALVARVKADPRLQGSEVRALVADGGSHGFLAQSTERVPGSVSMSSQPLDSYGTRVAPRFPMKPDVEAKVNGTTGRLVNLSITGSQVVAPIRVRPAEAIRLTFSDGSSDLRLAGSIAWVNLEIAAREGATRYRFGVEFTGADSKALEEFCLRHRGD